MAGKVDFDRCTVFTPDEEFEEEGGYFKEGGNVLSIYLHGNPDFNEVGCGVVLSRNGEIQHNTTIKSAEDKNIQYKKYRELKCYIGLDSSVSHGPAWQSPP